MHSKMVKIINSQSNFFGSSEHVFWTWFVCVRLPYEFFRLTNACKAFICAFVLTHKHIFTSLIYLMRCTYGLQSSKLFFVLFSTSMRILFHHAVFSALLLLYPDTMFWWQKSYSHTHTKTRSCEKEEKMRFTKLNCMFLCLYICAIGYCIVHCATCGWVIVWKNI